MDACLTKFDECLEQGTKVARGFSSKIAACMTLSISVILSYDCFLHKSKLSLFSKYSVVLVAKCPPIWLSNLKTVILKIKVILEKLISALCLPKGEFIYHKWFANKLFHMLVEVSKIDCTLVIIRIITKLDDFMLWFVYHIIKHIILKKKKCMLVTVLSMI